MREIDTIMHVIQYIEDHISERLDLCTIAQNIHLSRFHLHRLFTQTLALTIHDYLRRRQLTEAAKQLAFSKASILEIAISAGYESQQAFTKAFKAMYKLPPNLFREKHVFYPLQLPFIPVSTISLSGCRREEAPWHVIYANEADMAAWMELVRLAIDGYPFLDENQYMRALKESIDARQALIVRDDAQAVGAMIFSRESGNVDYMGIHPLFRNSGIAKLLLNKVKSILPSGSKQISITTYREGDRADTGYRKALKQLGFIESEFLYEFGYPTQKFLLSL